MNTPIIKSMHAPSEFRVTNTLRAEDCNTLREDQMELEIRGLRAQNAELLTALKNILADIIEPEVTAATWLEAQQAIAKAEGRE